MKIKKLFQIILGISALNSQLAFGLEQIIRPYQSIRSAGMGGVRLTTGLYDENFFNNPARMTANPYSKFTLLQLTPIDMTPATWSTASALIAGKDVLPTVTASAGSNLYERVQVIFPAYYHAAVGRKWAVSFGILESILADADLRQSYQASLQAIADAGIALGYARKFLKNDSLSIGLMGHFAFRAAATPDVSLVNYVSGSSINVMSSAGGGAMYNLDFGITWDFWHPGDFVVSFGGAGQNLLGGKYNTIPLKFGATPTEQPRSYGAGFSLSRASWAFLTNTVFALEATDVLNNMNGSVFRLIHIGAETHWKSLAFRLGVNQGYWCGGLGLDVRVITLDLATYGEEMGLNSGTLEDRRYAVNFGFHI